MHKKIHSDFKKKLSSNLFLRVLQVSDISDQYINWLNSNEIMQYTEQTRTIHNKENVTTFVSSMLNGSENYLFGIFEDINHIGNIKIGPIDLFHKTADISYVIGDKNYWGKGIASMAIKAISEIAFAELELEKIYAGVYENNIGSIKALQKNNFKEEGHFEDDVIFQGKRIDSFRYGLKK
jgi:RimJ/RimL family protein N-acetyltransferase